MLRAGIAAASLVLSLPAWGQMYKCVDAQGRTTYAEKPQPGCKGGPVDIRPIPPVGGAVKPPADDLSREENAFKRRQQARERAEAKDKAERAQRCGRAKSEFLRLDSRRRIIVDVNANGERVYLDDAARERRLSELREQLRGCG